MLESLDLLLRAIDKAIQLLLRRETERRRLFLDVAKPLFDELTPVVEDYFALFGTTIEKVKSARASDLRVTLSEITQLREKTLLARVKVRELASAIEQTTRDPKMREFASDILAIFYSTSHEGGRKMSRSVKAVDLLDLLTSEEGLLKAQVVEVLRQNKVAIENAWLKVSQTYAWLRIRSLK